MSPKPRRNLFVTEDGSAAAGPACRRSSAMALGLPRRGMLNVTSRGVLLDPVRRGRERMARGALFTVAPER